MQAQTPDLRERLLVQPAWLSEHLRDQNLVLLHVGPRAEYEAGHIPGARYLNHQDLAATDRSPGGLTLQMLAAEDLRQRLAAAGIATDSRIVLYFGRENPYVSPTARVMFTLDYAGLGDRASVLDGGLDAWVKAGLPLSTESAPGSTGKTRAAGRPAPRRGCRVREGEPCGPRDRHCRRAQPRFLSGRADGRRPWGASQEGHVQGAGNVPFGETVDQGGRLRPAAELRTLFRTPGSVRATP